MSEVIKKPYELSLWADTLETSPDEESKSYYKEVKLVTIGSDTMSAPNRAFDIVLKENINGEKTLTFSIRHRYFDNEKGEIVENPFTQYLNNERKIKLYYKDTWYDFILKECEETSEEYIFSYTAKDLFALELAKVGYNVTFNTDLNNNQGTITELAKKTLEQTDWVVDEDDSDLLKQTVKEPLYECTITQLGATFDVLNVDKDIEQTDFEIGETIYVFYSYIANKNTKFVQFIREKDKKATVIGEETIRDFEIDSDNVATSTNYRIKNEVIFELNAEEKPIKIKILNPDSPDDSTIITINKIYEKCQAYRLVYGQRTTYDPVMNRTVKMYQIDTDGGHQDIYSYTDAQYITSNIVTSFITSGTDFGILENGDIQGWSHLVPSTGPKGVSTPINMVTIPQISKIVDLNKIQNFANIQGYLEFKFPGAFEFSEDKIGKNAYFNSGIEDNASIVDHIAAGEKFVFRIRCGHSTKTTTDETEIIDNIIPFDPSQLPQEEGKKPGIRAVIAKYEIKDFSYTDEEDEVITEYTYNILPNSIILNFDGEFEISNNIITGGTFDTGNYNYIIDDVAQTPSSKYCYKVEGDDKTYVWSGTENKYIEKDSSFIDYYATTATAQMSFSTETLTDPLTKIGIFLYTEDEKYYGDNYTYIEDVQITRYYEDANHNLVTIGNVPESMTLETEYYYLKPTDKTKGEATNLYSSLKYLALENGLVAADIHPIYNEKCEKILSIQEEHSNCFNILQTLCETFECWLKLEVRRNKDGSLYLDSNNDPIKKVSFKEFIGKENFAGFKYGINLESINRTVDSNEIVTKLIVENVANEYTDSGTISIADAASNRNKDSYILNFSHYLNTGLIQEKETCESDVNKFYEEVEKLNRQIYEANKEKVKLAAAIDVSKANLNALETLLSEAKLMHSEAKADFEKATAESGSISYEEFVRRYNSGTDEEKEEVNKILESESIWDIIGEIYTGAVTASAYEGIVHNLQEEYRKLQFELYGAKEYNITVTTAPIEGSIGYTTTFVIDDYIAGLDFNLYRPAENGDGFSQHYISSLNERIFIATVTNNAPITHCVFNKLPNHYKLQYYKNNKPQTSLQDSNMDFIIYNPTQEGVLTRKYKLIPDEDWIAEHPNLDKIIDNITEEKKVLEKVFYKKYSRFIQEGTWSSQDYIDSELYYLDALQVSRTSAQPQVTYDIKVNEISELEGYGNYFFEVGDKTFIEDENFFGSVAKKINDKIFTTPVHEEIVVSEAEWHLDEPENNAITVQNYKTQFEDLFQRISATVQTVEYNEIKYPKTSSILNTSGLIDPALLLDSLNNTSTTGFNLVDNNNITIDNDGILLQDLTKTSNRVKINSKGIQTSPNAGLDWFNAIDGYGVNADALTTGTINTQNVWLMDGDNPSFRWDKSGISAYGFGETPSEEGRFYDYGTYVRLDKYGLYGVKNGENYVASSLENIKEKASFGLTWDGFFIKSSYTNGYVSISSDDDFQIVTTDEEQEFNISPETLESIELSSYNKQINFPYENCSIIKIMNGSGAEVEFTYENQVITIITEESDDTFYINYVRLLNTIDLGGKGIIELNSIKVNNELYVGEYTYNNETGVLTFSHELKPGDQVVINYKLERIKIGATKFVDSAPSKYGIEVRNRLGETVFETNDEGNLSVTGTINATDGVFNGTVYARDGEFTGHIRATSGEFPGSVTVGEENENYITISGEGGLPFIASGNYLNNDQEGWIIDSEGDATFNNVNVRGSIKTSVFEQGEIQTVGGAFMFRPSDSIEQASLKEVEIEVEGETSIRYDLVLTMKLGGQFKIGDLCKLGETTNLNDGLKAIYEIIEVSEDGKTIVLEGAGERFKDRIEG